MAHLNLNWYSGPDPYSDGPVEDELLEIVSRQKDFAPVLAADHRWPILYHLAPERRNLLDWYPFDPQAELLEVGAGCGALTGLFCEKTARVTAVELSARRSRIIAQRYADIERLEVVAGNVLQVSWDRPFDVITLIGVLEYTRAFVKSARPYREFLTCLGSLLKSDGQLIVAVENRLGLKYWAGTPEDHTGRLFDGIEGYPQGAPVETFSKDEITWLLQDGGFGEIQFYYPWPDYKLPREIFSDAGQPRLNHKFDDLLSYDRERFRLFSEKLALFNVIKNGQFDFFANSFLITARRRATS